MQSDVRRALLLIAQSKDGIPSDAPRLRGMLLDERKGEDTSDIRALAMALEVNFLGNITAEQSRSRSWESCSSQLIQKFIQQTGLRDDMARWVVESWWAALATTKTPQGSGANTAIAPSTSVQGRSSNIGIWIAATTFILLIGYVIIKLQNSRDSAQEQKTPTGTAPSVTITPTQPPIFPSPTLQPTPTPAIAKQMVSPKKADTAANFTPPKQTLADPTVITNSLGIRLLKIASGRWLSSTDVRVSDFAAFAEATAYPSNGTITTVGKEGWQEVFGSWKRPGFQQSKDDPAVAVSWEDAKLFCRWLTASERQGNRIGPTQTYRLPTEAEWLSALDLPTSVYPWGNAWPLTSTIGNFAGEEVLSGKEAWPEDWSSIQGYIDRYPRTSPVSSFSPNNKGFYDMEGNVLQWCEDRFSESSPNRVLRGSSWADYQQSHLRADARQGNSPAFRATTVGFRIILITE